MFCDACLNAFSEVSCMRLLRSSVRASHLPWAARLQRIEIYEGEAVRVKRRNCELHNAQPTSQGLEWTKRAPYKAFFSELKPGTYL